MKSKKLLICTAIHGLDKICQERQNRNFPNTCRFAEASGNSWCRPAMPGYLRTPRFCGRAQDCPGKFFRGLELNWFLRKPCPSYGAPIARLSNKFNLRRKKGLAGGALSYGFLIYGVNKQRAARGFGKGMEILGSVLALVWSNGWRCNIKRLSNRPHVLTRCYPR